MNWLVLLHVVSAIVGVGPAYFLHVLLRKQQTVGELRVSMNLSKTLEFFPKIGGSIAVLSGLLLVVISDWAFREFWIWGSIVMYVLIQIVVIGYVGPRLKKIVNWVKDYNGPSDAVVPQEQQAWLARANYLMYVASFFGLVLFTFMVLKPHL
ncbi:putative membrane protein [Paenibacillus castaneae]|uniref:DUF2269 family protein n=1 Tax=Paenibacillus castaneae TaxID=474957 RepID=UPI000C9A6702|nr:DUF2269 family protein [Paenibacillus castaneae]NIK79904.1 putative membrane protein [Paenibacillus castaneae]